MFKLNPSSQTRLTATRSEARAKRTALRCAWRLNERNATEGVPYSAVIALLCLLPAAQLFAQPAAHEFKGPQACVRCHTSASPLDARDLVLLNESPIWLEKDKHAKAFELLQGELGQGIGKRLGIENVQKDQRCLSCHANWHVGSKTPPAFSELGVTCESCHGPSSNWVAPHAEVAWRGKTPAEKARLGMVDVREPLGRARQCFSCHIGRADEGKVLTHEMYAAGHPPLPSIELESFAEQMPAHWRYLPERGKFELQDKFVAANYPDAQHDPLADLPRTKGVVVGGVVALQESVRLFASQFADSNRGPELAVFDCGACHHDLRSPSWRQARGFGGSVPGRPTMSAWPTALVKAALRQSAGADDAAYAKAAAELDGRLAALRLAVAARPFGDGEKVRSAADELDNFLTAQIAALSKSPFDEAAARRALLALCELSPGDFPDYHSARQIAWGVRSIYTELHTKYPTFTPRPETEESRADRRAREDKDAEALLAWRGGPRKETAARINQLFDKLELTDKLFLTLPSGQEHKIDVALPASLKRLADYDPLWFRKQLAELKKGVEKPIVP